MEGDRMDFAYVKLTEIPNSLRKRVEEEIEKFSDTEIICMFRTRPNENTDVYHVYLDYYTNFTILRLKIENQKEQEIEVTKFDVGDINFILRHKPEVKAWLI
jgi:hypothetical protein